MENEASSFWKGKKVKIEILKDGKKLFYTASIISIDNFHITFIDRDCVTFSFNKNLVREIEVLGDNGDS